MKRRDVLLVGAATATGSGCATLLAGALPGEGELFRALAVLDDALARLSTTNVLERLFEGAPVKPKSGPELERGEALARKTLKALVLASAVHDLPTEQATHPAVTARLAASSTELDEAVLGMTDLLEGLTPDERARVSTALKEDPDLGMRIAGAIDARAADYGVSAEGRLKLRRLAATASTRLRQSPDHFIAEYTTKLRKLEAHVGRLAQAERERATALGEALLFQGEAPVEQEAAGGATQPTPPPLPEPTVAPPPPAPKAQPAKAADARRQRANPGGLVMGIGGSSLGLGIILVLWGASSSSSLVLATIGALMGVAGLIVLIIGIIVYAANS